MSTQQPRVRFDFCGRPMEGTVAAERPTPRVDAPLGTKLVVDVPDRGTYGVLESDAEFLP